MNGNPTFKFCRRFWKAVFYLIWYSELAKFCINIGPCWLQTTFLCVELNCVPLEFFSWSYSVLLSEAVGILDGIFPLVHRTFLLSYFRGCRLSDFFPVLKVWGHITKKRQSSWRQLFLSKDFTTGMVMRLMKLNFWRRKRYRIRLDPSCVYLDLRQQ